MDNLSKLERDFVYLDEGNGCWLWKGLKFRSGYGRIGDKRTHRVFYEHYIGPIPKGMCVCHMCDVKHCVNPDHLWLGTHTDNHKDCEQKNRLAKGDKHGSRTHPEKVARGDRHGSRIHPEKWARGDKHYSHTHPEKVARVRGKNGQFVPTPAG